MITVRTVSIGKDIGSPAITRDRDYATRREALGAISRLGALSSIVRFGRLYVVTPSKSQGK